jgi:DNA-binding MarR family transcriptional regulator
MSTTPRPRPANRDPEGEFPLDVTTYVFHLFAVTSRHREARLDEILKSLDLNLSRHRALSVIARLAPCTMSELAEFSAVDRTTLTRTLDQLVEAGLAAREVPSQDRRQVLLTLTPEGRDVYGRSLKAIAGLNRALLAQMPEEDQRRVARAFEHFLGNLVEDEALRRRLTLREPPST